MIAMLAFAHRLPPDAKKGVSSQPWGAKKPKIC
jgi:hypothetical protein